MSLCSDLLEIVLEECISIDEIKQDIEATDKAKRVAELSSNKTGHNNYDNSTDAFANMTGVLDREEANRINNYGAMSRNDSAKYTKGKETDKYIANRVAMRNKENYEKRKTAADDSINNSNEVIKRHEENRSKVQKQ